MKNETNKRLQEANRRLRQILKTQDLRKSWPSRAIKVSK